VVGENGESIRKGGKGQQTLLVVGQTLEVYKKRRLGAANLASGGGHGESLRKGGKGQHTLLVLGE
jgi:hypothetical protein